MSEAKNDESGLNDLLSCPFCGEAPNLKKVPAGKGIGDYVPKQEHYFVIACELCLDDTRKGCGILRSDWSEEKVIVKWNTRTT